MDATNDEKQQKSVFIDDSHQKELNTPLAVQGGIKAEDKEFLEFVLSLVKEGKIDLFVPHTLINDSVYDNLSEKEQGEVDIEAVNTLSAIRKIKDLHDAGFDDSYQMENLVQKVRIKKENFENSIGDVFII